MATYWCICVAILGCLDISSAIDMYGLSYNYFDEMAQNYCAAKGEGWVLSIRRDCFGLAPTCNDICTSAKIDILNAIDNQATEVACFDGIFIKKGHKQLLPNPYQSQPDAEKASLVFYGYGSGGCTWAPNHCGPNYCCCTAFK
ncbi:uncharacterized protein LOC127859368 [Dreissena polymorpha]|uniref:Uncharacterized protein n=1 Tax=Dreissena polymorpha TaxID=45954 RepID=A0A9D4BJH2_DREPO|nr:uncharacterized protein LOC127859368 [Dreissena polymorpha]KAH3705630.1 hypothetical protein DPMN_080707 [Dreissena polymorpha]